MILCKDLRSAQGELRTLISDLKAQGKAYPPFKIMRTRSRGKEIYVRVDYFEGKRKRKIIDHESADFFDVLKGLCIDAKKEIAENDLLLLNTLEEQYRDISPVEIIDLLERKYPKLERRDILAAVSDLEQSAPESSDWAKETYRKAEFIEDGRTQITSRGLKVRSKSEAAICEILYANGIEFRYEEIMYINGRKVIPDFTIRRKSDGKIFYWEHCGMMDDPAYLNRYHEKIGLYEFGGIVPWDNLILTYDNDGNIDLSYIEAIVRTVLAA